MSTDTEQRTVPSWLLALDDEDFGFLRRFLLGSGSLKAVAQEYGVSYPTVRARLDRLIAKVRITEESESLDRFELRLRAMVIDGKLSPTLARELLNAHRETIDAKEEV